jgi:hypothetical protein
MARLEDLTRGAAVGGLRADELITTEQIGLLGAA